MWRMANVRYGVSFCANVTISQLSSGYAEARNVMVSIKRKHTLFRDLCKPSHQCRSSFSDRSQECSATRIRHPNVSSSSTLSFSRRLSFMTVIRITLTPFNSIRARRMDAIVKWTLNESWCLLPLSFVTTLGSSQLEGIAYWHNL